MTTPFEELSLGIISSKICWRDPEGVKTTGGFGRQIEEFSRHFRRTVLLVPFTEEREVLPGYRIQIEDLCVIPLPAFDGAGLRGKLDFLQKLPVFFRQIWNAYPVCDLWQFRLPSYPGLLGVFVFRLRRSRPCFIWLGTDWPERIRESGNTLLRRLLAALANGLMRWALRGIPTFALGELAGKYADVNPYIHTTISTILSPDDFPARTTTGLASPPRLLFVGRLALEKGLSDLLDTLHLAGQSGLVLDLTLVGDGPEREKLKALASRYDLQSRVHFRGYIPAGEALWQVYSQADMFILPSLSEAQGKVLVEAMAAGLPIVATCVGGIPSIIQHGKTGLLVAPHSPSDLLAAIQSMLADSDLRHQLGSNAVAAARTLTIKEQTERIVQQLVSDFASLEWCMEKL